MKIRTLGLAVGLVFSGCVGGSPPGQEPGSADYALEEDTGTPEPQVVHPIHNQTVLDPNDTYVEPSADEVLPVGARLDLRSEFELLLTPYVVQRLTERTYYIAINVYAVTMYVGDQGVLLIDTGGHGGPDELEALLEAVRSVTPLPITAIVLSHPHTDHVGNSVALAEMFPEAEIIGSQWLAEQIELYDYPIAYPTTIVRRRNGMFTFEGERFRMVTPAPVAHTPADSYVVTPDRVLHVVDFVHAGRLTFIEASVVQNTDGFIRMLRHLAGEVDNYDYLNPGHLNVGYASDVERSLDYYRALYGSWWEVMMEVSPESFVDPTQDNAAVWFRNFFDEVAVRMFDKVAPAFGHVRFFEVARDHASKVHENQFLHRLNATDPTSFGSMPEFTPIAPRGPGL
jgi:glyoxylase-like metal-dependent hydrolase (beta-lactamase superfamily II)